MGTDPIKTWGVGQAQVFDAEFEPAAEQERLNRVLTPKVPDSLTAQRIAHVLDDLIFLDSFLEQGHKLLLEHGLPANPAKPEQAPRRKRVPTRGRVGEAQRPVLGEARGP